MFVTISQVPKNDAKIKSTIDLVLEDSEASISDRIMANLLLLKYQIFQRDNDKVMKQSEQLDALFETNTAATNLKGLKMAFDATLFQIELMK